MGQELGNLAEVGCAGFIVQKQPERVSGKAGRAWCCTFSGTAQVVENHSGRDVGWAIRLESDNFWRERGILVLGSAGWIPKFLKGLFGARR